MSIESIGLISLVSLRMVVISARQCMVLKKAKIALVCFFNPINADT